MLPNAKTEQAAAITELSNRLDSVDVNLITMGAFLHPELTRESLVPPEIVKKWQGKFPHQHFFLVQLVKDPLLSQQGDGI